VIVGNAFTTANHPLQSLLSWCCTPLGVEPWIRLPSMLSGAAAVLGAWWIGRATREGPWLASAMAITIAILPAAVNAGGEARGYGLMIAASALSTGLLLMALRHGGSWRWIAYAIVLALGVWAHFLTAMVGVGHAAVALWMLRRAPERSATALILRAVCCAGLLSLALWSPALPDLLHTRGQFAAVRGNEPSLLGTQGLLLLWQMVGMTPLPMHKAGIDGTRALLTALPALALMAIGAATCFRDRQARRALALAALGLPLAVLLAWLGGSWLYARFLLFAVPGTVLLLAAGARRLLDIMVAQRHAFALRIACAQIVPLFICMCLAYDLGSGPRQPIREAVARVAEHRAPEDRVLGIGIADDVVQWYALAFDLPIEPTGIGGERLPDALARGDARWIVALYPNHRHPEASAKRLHELGFRLRPLHGFQGWLDGGEGTVEVWERGAEGP
jgi:mannosyltransferase